MGGQNKEGGLFKILAERRGSSERDVLLSKGFTQKFGDGVPAPLRMCEGVTPGVIFQPLPPGTAFDPK